MTGCGHDHLTEGHASDGHCDGDHAQHSADGGRLASALAVIVVFMFVEIVGGVISGSLALLADAGHMLTDALALGLALSAHRMSARPATGNLHFGYRRMQVLAAFVNGIALLGLTSWILVEAFHRATAPALEVKWAPMLAIAALGLAANGVAFRLLHQAGEHNINIKGAMLHVASDLLGSVAAIIAAITIWLTGWTRIDPILSVIVAALIARSALKLLKETTHILLEGAPSNIDAKELAHDLRESTPEVVDVHSVMIWQLTPDQPRLTLHARLREGGAADAALQSLKARLEKRYGIKDSTIQIEATGECPDDRHHGGGHHHEPHDHGGARVPHVRLHAVH